MNKLKKKIAPSGYTTVRKSLGPQIQRLRGLCTTTAPQGIRKNIMSRINGRGCFRTYGTQSRLQLRSFCAIQSQLARLDAKQNGVKMNAVALSL